MSRVLVLVAHGVEVISAKMGEGLLLVPLKTALGYLVLDTLSLTDWRTVVVQILLISSFHLSILALVIALGHLVVADVIVNLVVDGLLHYIPIGISFRGLAQMPRRLARHHLVLGHVQWLLVRLGYLAVTLNVDARNVAAVVLGNHRRLRDSRTHVELRLPSFLEAAESWNNLGGALDVAMSW